MLSRSTLRRGLSTAVCVVLVGGVLGAGARGDDAPPAPAAPPLVAAVERDRPALPAGSTDRGRAGVESSALRLARAVGGVPADATSPCPADRLRVSWEPPADGYAVGAHVDPVGPAPDAATTAVNGLVLCDGTRYAYLGFEARWDGGTWQVHGVPVLGGEHEDDEHAHEEPETAHEDEHEDGEHAAPAEVAPAPAPAPAPEPVRTLGGLTVPGGAIEGYAAYDPQRTCDPVAKPGVVALRDLLLRTYPMSRSLGISRACSVGGLSEHKEGRAFDWGVDVSRPAERAAAEAFVSSLLATDAAGNPHALARRLGVMYLIWDRQIWSAYSTSPGWRPYTGASPHTDHVHVSLSWDGAMGRTSFWQGAHAALLQVDPELRLAEPSSPAGTAVVPVVAAPRPHDDGREKAALRKAARREEERLAAEQARVAAEAAAAAAVAEHERQVAAQAAAKAAHEAQKAAERAAREARKAAERAAREQARGPATVVTAAAPAKAPKAPKPPPRAVQPPKAAKAPKAPKAPKAAPKAAKIKPVPAGKGGGKGKG